MGDASLVKKILRLKREKGVTVLAHYYTAPVVQDVADFIGDSLGLAQMAEKSDSKKILFCGARYMAETAAILAPEKEILMADSSVGCTVAQSMSPNNIKEWRELNPDGIVISYVNSSSEIKAASHICCTSSNALKIFSYIPEDKKILFGPNKNLANYVKEITNREFDTWKGECTI
ncbi:MAG: quinolinate synthase NadA, partial [Bacteroidales bacterium]